MTLTPFRDQFRHTFGQDYPGAAVDLQLPRLRFKLACGKVPLAEAEHRCRQLYDYAFRESPDIWVELEFHTWLRARSPEASMRILSDRGLTPVNDQPWDVIRRARDHDLPTTYSSRVATDSPGFEYLFRAVILADHGTWKRITPSVLLFDPHQGLGFHPYDDRGADLFAPASDRLQPIFVQFNTWILDYDRTRIEQELSETRHGA